MAASSTSPSNVHTHAHIHTHTHTHTHTHIAKQKYSTPGVKPSQKHQLAVLFIHSFKKCDICMVKAMAWAVCRQPCKPDLRRLTLTYQ